MSKYIYTNKFVNSVAEYLKALEDGYTQIIIPDELRQDLLNELNKHRNDSFEYELEYAKVLLSSDKCEENQKIYFETCNSLYNKGFEKALNGLAFCYALGYGVEKDVPKSIELYSISAEKGNPISNYNLYVTYRYEEGFVDKERAREYLLKSIDKGYARADMFYGRELYFEDNPESLIWLDKAYKQKQDKSYYIYSLACLKFGEYEKAIPLLKETMEKEGVPMYGRIGMCYKKLGDLQNAFDWFVKGIDNKSSDCYYKLSDLFQEVDLKKSMELKAEGFMARYNRYPELKDFFIDDDED